MPTAPYPTEQTAFRATPQASSPPPYGSGAARGVARASVSAPKRPAPTPQPVAPPRRRAQSGLLLFMVFGALIVLGAGLAYLSGYAQVTKEGYRRVALKAQLRREKELAQQWRQMEAVVSAPGQIEHQARALGMTRASDKEAIVVR